MTVLFFIIFIVGLVIWFIWFLQHYVFIKNMMWNYKHCNVITFGKKGSGKDLITNYVVNKRKEFYYSNIPYSEVGTYEIITPNDISIAPNDYKHFVENNIVKIPHRFKEGCDYYISDMGVYLPSYMDSTLYKLFPSLPPFYALSRHLYNANVHMNVQNVERGWKAIREQADFFVMCVRTRKFLFWTFTSVITYDRYDSARQGLRPLKKRMLNKISKAQYDLYVAQNGDIRKGTIIQRKKNIKYDTRAFEKIVLSGERIY